MCLIKEFFTNLLNKLQLILSFLFLCILFFSPLINTHSDLAILLFSFLMNFLISFLIFIPFHKVLNTAFLIWVCYTLTIFSFSVPFFTSVSAISFSLIPVCTLILYKTKLIFLVSTISFITLRIAILVDFSYSLTFSFLLFLLWSPAVCRA